MIDFVYGIIQEKETDYVVLDVSGIGYKVFIPARLTGELPIENDTLRLHTHYIHKEDVVELYGFISKMDRNIFRHLITVSGIGAKLGMKILTALTYQEIIQFILDKNIDSLTTVSGLGKKGAEKIILELQSKFKKLYPYPIEAETIHVNVLEKTSIDALLALGYREKEAKEAVSSVIKKENPASEEEIIKASLKILAKIT